MIPAIPVEPFYNLLLIGFGALVFGVAFALVFGLIATAVEQYCKASDEDKHVG